MGYAETAPGCSGDDGGGGGGGGDGDVGEELSGARSWERYAARMAAHLPVRTRWPALAERPGTRGGRGGARGRRAWSQAGAQGEEEANVSVLMVARAAGAGGGGGGETGWAAAEGEGDDKAARAQ